MSHLKTFAAPKTWSFLRKVSKFITRPLPGAHDFTNSQPLVLLLKQRGLAKTTGEARKIVRSGAVSVDGRVVKEPRFCVGFMDSIHIKPDLHLRGSIDSKGRLAFVEVESAESSKKVCRVDGKRIVKGGKFQVSLLGGRNIKLEKVDVKVGDSLVISVPEQKVLDRLELKPGCTVFLLGGSHKGKLSSVVSVKGSKVNCKSDNQEFETLKKFAFVVGKEKPVVKL